ncbi:protein mono-ADP-ribosyltransferase PARP16 [Teleopsis dalmanni]|uniref:protein mono-ADP-ribosyltransferase PARP16 n=1 Tax=Teleopsis dalmanni TaxID=139649 RepID=UPI0018CFEA54|nr:protein mono-ADP-ribosyltransferase PARP16 [Teleopsis dalmanni]
MSINTEESSVESSSLNDTNNLPMEDEQAIVQLTRKVKILGSMLRRDLLALDIKWTLFVAASKNYRYEELLKPYPPQFFIEPEGVDIDRLLLVINLTPNLICLLNDINQENYNQCDMEVIDLLTWVLIDNKQPVFQSITIDAFAYYMHNIVQNINIKKPDHIFEIIYDKSDKVEQVFRSRGEVYGFKFSYCGYKAEYLYSVFHNSFYNCGVLPDILSAANTYLHFTSEIAVSLVHSPPTPCWGKSQCGSVLRCVLLCEFINMPQYVKSQIDVIKEYSYLDIYINRGDIVRPRFMLVYDDDKLWEEEQSVEEDVKADIEESTWFSRNRFGVLAGLCCFGIFIFNVFHKKGCGGVIRRFKCLRGKHFFKSL